MNVEISPNYVNEQSKLTETQLGQIIEKASEFGINLHLEELDRETTVAIAKELIPERWQLVNEKLSMEGLTPEQLDDKTLFDRLLGIDELINLNGKLIVIDVTSGNGTLLYNKKSKFETLKPVFDKIGIAHAIVVSIKGNLSDEQVISLFNYIDSLEDNEFSTVLKFRNQSLDNN